MQGKADILQRRTTCGRIRGEWGARNRAAPTSIGPSGLMGIFTMSENITGFRQVDTTSAPQSLVAFLDHTADGTSTVRFATGRLRRPITRSGW